MFEAKFQSFADASSSEDSAARVAALRAELKRQNLDGYLLPRADAHQNEYVPKSAERLAWLTGFTGSAGFAVVLAKEAAIFIDGRYVIQVRHEIDGRIFKPIDIAETSPAQWLSAQGREGARIGYDPWVHTSGQIERFAKAAEAKRIELVPLERNPIDALWTDRPPEPVGPVSLQPQRYAGETAAAKIKKLRGSLKGADAMLMSDPHAICWAFNIRGADVAHTPIALCFALLPKDGAPRLYIDDAKLDARTRAALEKLLSVQPPAALIDDMIDAGKRGDAVLFDAATAPVKLIEALREAGGKARVADDPAALLKAVKNKAELAGARAAHIRDGAALTRFLAWFAEAAPKGGLTEITAAEALETFRRETGALRDISFPTISAFSEHAAIPHYRVTEKSNLKIGKGVYLVDSGAQYLDGTTDVTRTVVVGRASRQLKDHFTRVLKGHIAIARAVFPKGASGAQLDAFARRPLWEAGLDFDHGVGHGVGAYLSVHEGPQRISKLGTTPLQPGMILSNEPGYYRAGEYGIRLENLVIVETREIAGAERDMYGFETITLAPFDLNCVDARLMSAEEIAWLNAYHAHVRKTLSPLVDARTRRWLREATRAI
ncbi:aminopeptidase P family protein [Methylocystis echinoides]|uniref:aminopeptidase P family protein n=1 Tax=Methylocystis echinoides TaxID=29468 RepID=UPI0034141A21